MKIIKKILVPIVFSPVLERRFSHVYESTVPIFVLHRSFNGEFKDAVLLSGISYLLKKGFSFITVGQLQQRVDNGKSLNRCIVLTFDDGYKDQYDLINELVTKFDINISFCLIGDLVFYKKLPWDEKARIIVSSIEEKAISFTHNQEKIEISISSSEGGTSSTKLRGVLAELSAVERDEVINKLEENYGVKEEKYRTENLVEWEDIKDKSGIEYIPHTMSHCVMSSEPTDAAEIDLRQCIQSFKDRDISSYKILAYPLGKLKHYNVSTLELVTKVGFDMCLTTEEGYFNSKQWKKRKEYRTQVPRFGMPRTKEEFLLYSSWLGRYLEKYDGFKLFEYIKNQYGSKRDLIRFFSYYLTGLRYRQHFSSAVKWSRVERLVFVCAGNICRSPFAEKISKDKDVDVASCGINAIKGRPADDGAITGAMQVGYDLSQHSSCNIKDLVLTDQDLLVLFDPKHLSACAKYIDGSRCQVAFLGEWSKENNIFIADPYGKSMKYFVNCFARIEQAVDNLISDWKRER